MKRRVYLYSVVYLDIEASLEGVIKEVGLVYDAYTLKTSSIEQIKEFLTAHSPTYIAGHNIVHFDKVLLDQTSLKSELEKYTIIDTLPASLLLFNEKTFHNLPKKYKNEDAFYNDPVEDSKLTRTLFEKTVRKFRTIPKKQQIIFYSLLHKKEEFIGFFSYFAKELQLQELVPELLEKTIAVLYDSVIVNKSVIKDIMLNHKIELAYILALLTPVTEIKAHPPKILFDYPEISKIQTRLCFNVEESCNNLNSFAEDTFGFGSFRSFQRLGGATLFAGDEISQREIVEASLKDESFIAVLPTGGGKTFTFWLPALIKAKAYKSLTVVISPLQALIKDHIESFEKQVANFTAVAISGFLTPLERSNAIDKVINGDADILYLAPESLRSNAIFSMLKNRVIERFVIDEAHCLSTWGNDFRHDYFYIGEFISDLLEEKTFQSHIPISCFTATAKPNVIDDIESYIDKSLDIRLGKYLAMPQRENLEYEAYEVQDKKQKYRNLLKLINEREGATLIYIPSSTKLCDEIAEQLKIDTNKSVAAFHSKLETELKMKILDEYINNVIDIVVATTAFGMGVDKPNILNVIHYEASESLENYSQEAGRGARDQNLKAQCPLLFDENDLDKHFNTLNRTKLSSDEINAVFRVIKNSSQNPLLKTTLEIAKDAHWDVEDKTSGYDMKIKTSLLELEREGYLERKRNRVRYFGDSIAQNSLEKLHCAIQENEYDNNTAQRLVLILQTILGRGKPQAVQIDELALLLGYDKQDVAEALLTLKELQIITESRDMSLFISRDSLEKYNVLLYIERALFNYLKPLGETTVNLRELNEMLITKKVITQEDNMSAQIKEILKFWRAKEIFQFNRIDRHKDVWYVTITNLQYLQNKNKLKHKLAALILHYFTDSLDKKTKVKKFEQEFSLIDLKNSIAFEGALKEVEKVLLYLHEMKLLELSQGRFIYYAPMSLHKTPKVNQKNRYTKEEYKNRMAKHYQQKIEAIHIMGEYSHYLLKDKQSAANFMKDYFILSYEEFKKKYKLTRKISQPLTQKKSQQIYSKLSDEQQNIMQDKTSKGMMILAGPGSGKTKVLVHKIAALILNEDVKPEQFLMLTYSRTAMIEFKSRLYGLIGSLAGEVDIATFHGYALQLVARQLDEQNQILLQSVISQATSQIINKDIEIPFKTVLVLDEYQDINEEGFLFIKAIYESLFKDLRIIAVGDDDQCIMEHTNGASIEYIEKFKTLFSEDDRFTTYELLNNFRSDVDLIRYAQIYISKVDKRFKQNSLIPQTKNKGKIEFIHTTSKHLIQPTIDICKNSELIGTTIFLAHTNNEVISLYSHLKELGFEVTYLLDNVGYKIKNLIEIYEFNEMIQLEEMMNEDTLYKILQDIKAKYHASKNFKYIQKVVKIFIESNDILTLSIWNEFLDELEMSMLEEKASFNISTIHKAKGREFDNVVMMLPNAKEDSYFRRLYYVGMTRAKHNLYIISNNKHFNLSNQVPMTIKEDEIIYPEPNLVTFLMSLKDINLGFTSSIELNAKDIIAGKKVKLIKKYHNKPRVIFQEQDSIAQISKGFEAEIVKYENKGYQIIDIEIESVIHWEDKKQAVFKKHPLCKFMMRH
jgi:ATP-dependent DNA helicase RecQ